MTPPQTNLRRRGTLNRTLFKTGARLPPGPPTIDRVIDLFWRPIDDHRSVKPFLLIVQDSVPAVSAPLSRAPPLTLACLNGPSTRHPKTMPL
ncbi:MAG TPA: hypothetical protein DCG72_10300 [Gammaproteobacteria bacterium]|nr:hypothetical protein [Gammaproteobacteria bacterium]